MSEFFSDLSFGPNAQKISLSKAIIAGGHESELSQLGTRMEDVAGKLRSLKEQMKQISDDQVAASRILHSLAKQQGLTIELDDNDE